MNRKIQKRALIPPWDMPSDPVKAVFWFMHWSLKILVNFFWLPIIVMVIIESYLNWTVGGISNALVGGIVTLLVGVALWAILYVLVLALGVSTSVSRLLSDLDRMQQDSAYRRPFSDKGPDKSKVVEGTITDLEQERKKRRNESKD